MTCPICDHTMQMLRPTVFWCPQCGTVNHGQPVSEQRVERPKIVTEMKEHKAIHRDSLIAERCQGTVMLRRPWLRKHFWVQPGYRGWDICWYQWSPIHGWGRRHGLRFSTVREAKTIRRFLNSKVQRAMKYGLPFAEVVRLATGGSVNPDDPHAEF